MIDTKKLRRLTQDATPGPWKMLPVGDGMQKVAVADSEFLSILTVTDDDDARFIAAANPAAITELLDRLEAAEKERDELRAEVESWKGLAQQFGKEADALRTKVAEMERQEPVGKFVQHPSNGLWEQDGYGDNPDANPLYALPGAQAQPAPSIPEGWLRAIDEALVVAHIGVANADDTYEEAKAKLERLIGFHVDVATDPAVNGGYKLVPIEPTEEIYQCFSAYDGTSYSNPFDRDEFLKDWHAALAKAPETK